MNIKFCPKCKSTEVETIREGSIAGQPYTESYMCSKCGFVSKTFPEVKNKEDLRKA